MATTYYYSVTETHLGPILIASDQVGICMLVFHRPQHTIYEQVTDYLGDITPLVEAPERHHAYSNDLRAYLAGTKRNWYPPLHLHGTDFQKQVWDRLLAIPYGETRSYTDIAEAIGRPSSTRAVANACGANPVGLIVPCHRVVHKDGSLSGYAGGIEKKRALLDMESRVAQARMAA